MAIDAAVLPLDKMVGIKDTCKSEAQKTRVSEWLANGAKRNTERARFTERKGGVFEIPNHTRER